MRDAGGARLCAPKRFLAPRQPQPIKVKLADQRDDPSPSQAEGAMPTGAILTKAGAILPNRTATPGEELHQIAPNCTKLHQIAVAPKNQKGENQAGRKVFRPKQWATCRRQASAVARLWRTSWREKTARQLDNGKMSIIP
jgi:hypothetical protein